MSVRLRLSAAALAVLPLLTALLVAVPQAEAGPTWAPVATAKIRPGVQMYTGGAQCTSNYVFTDAANNVYVGYAAHCAGKGDSSDINGCTTPSQPLGTPVTFVTGGNFFSSGTTVGRGTLAYSSWVSMQKIKFKGELRCIWNDFALVRVSNADKGKVNPTVPFWGGPRTFGGAPLGPGAKIFTVGNSSLRNGTAKAKTSTIIQRTGGGLGYDIKGGAGIPGDSGSGYMDATGRAIGVLSTISIGLQVGGVVTNTIGDIYHEILWARQYSGIKGLRLVPGTLPFNAAGGVS